MIRQVEEYWVVEISFLDIEGFVDRIIIVIEQEVNRFVKKFDVIVMVMVVEIDGVQVN